MVKTEASITTAADAAADLLILPIFEGLTPGPGTKDSGLKMGADLIAVARDAGLKGKLGDTLVLPTLGALPSATVVITGVGKREDAGPRQIRTAAMYAVKATEGFVSVASTLPQIGDKTEASRAFAEGVLLASYRFDRYRSEPNPDHVPVTSIVALVEGDRRPASAGLKTGRIHAECANWARDLVNTPAAHMTPALIADAAKTMAKEQGLECKIWTRRELEAGGFGGILAVGRASANEPRLIELRYAGAGRDKPIAITGKGITFDAGGLNLKPPNWMETMKIDMSGAAAALATMRGIAESGLKINVVAAIGCAENMPGGDANRPGDVITHRGGSTSEVVDPDAEGRLLLADVLAYLSESKPKAIIDSATLTDTGLGEDLWAIFGTDDELVAELLAAGEAAGQSGWRFPLWEPYKRHTKSHVADVSNGVWVGADTLHSGLFLRHFVADGIPWAHLDVGNTAFIEFARQDEWPETGATGNPTRVLLRYLESQQRRR